MSLIKWEPFGEFDRVFNNTSLPLFSRLDSDLAADVYVENNTVMIKMSLPGIKADEIEINIEDGQLNVAGHREEEHETKEKNYYSKEIRRGSFSRSISLPKPVQAGKASASFTDGILSVAIPLVEGAEDTKVSVPVASSAK